jgi:hypothetical protein
MHPQSPLAGPAPFQSVSGDQFETISKPAVARPLLNDHRPRREDPEAK